MKRKFWLIITTLIVCMALISNLTIVILADDIFISAGELDGVNYAESLHFPIFDGEVNYSRGQPTATSEDYLNYKAYKAKRHEYADMIGHKSEVSAVRLAEKGIFKKSENFSPNGSMTVMDFMRALLKISGSKTVANGSANEVINVINKSGLIGDSVKIDYTATLTNEYLAYFLGQAATDTSNASQYRLLLDDFDSISEPLRSGVLDSIAAGITEIDNFKLNPKTSAKRSDIADGLYRLYNASARVIPLFDLGDSYNEETDSYLVKSTYEKNESGLQQGFFTNYNKQADAFLNYGSLPIDRTGFYKWSKIEKKNENGEIVYEMPNFNNDKSSHKAGNTIINCIDISANLYWNDLLSESYIPSWYTQDITNSETRAAAKKFLKAFVKEMMTQVNGDVILAIDYEVDNFLGLWNNAWGKYKAKAFAEWFAEACEVAREAAAELGKRENLKLIVIYDRITKLHRLGVGENQWMLDVAKVADYIGLDSYDFYEDRTDASVTLECIRFLMNNYSLGKPVIVVENGIKMKNDFSEIDPVTGLNQLQLATQYYKNLYREFRFALERGDFLNANLSGFLFWSYYDTNDTADTVCGIVDSDNTLRDNGIAIKEGIDSLYKQKQFNPSKLKNVSAITGDSTVNVKSGTEYDELTIIANGNSSDGTGAVSVKLDNAASVFVTVNGEEYYTDYRYVKNHSIEVKNLRRGTNVIKIQVGCEQVPFSITVKEAKLILNTQSNWSEVSSLPDNNLISNKSPYTIVTSKGNSASVNSATGGASLKLWTNGELNEDMKALYEQSSKNMLISYSLDSSYGIKNIILSSGDTNLPRQTKWKAYLADDFASLFDEENCITYVTNDAGNKKSTQYVTVNKNKLGKFFGIKLLDNSTDDPNAYISEIGIYLLVGDANLDGSFDIRDIVHLKKHITGVISAKNINSVDYDSNKKLDAKDLTTMRKLLIKAY